MTSLALGALDPGDVVVASRDGSGWRLRFASGDKHRWRIRPGTTGAGTIIDTAIALAPGEQLALVDPPVRDGGPTTELVVPKPSDPVGAPVRDGASVAIEPAGSVTVEPDADRDGFGDQTEDLCPGVGGAVCAPGHLRVSIDGPGYVPALDPVLVHWTVTNVGSEPQPIALEWSSRTNVDRFEGPPGTECDPSAAASVPGRWVPTEQWSPLVRAELSVVGSPKPNLLGRR